MSQQSPRHGPERVAYHILIEGFVQGVGYRNFVFIKARELSIRGWVRNLDDGRVEIWAEGSAVAVVSLIERCRRGPTHASVERVVERNVPPEGHNEFRVAATADKPRD